MHYLKRKRDSFRWPRWLRDIGWWFQYRFNPKHRYHVIRFAEPGWIDRDHAMLRCCFMLLDEFLTKEPIELIDWNSDPEHRHAITEMRLLHFWWKHQRDADNREARDLFDRIWKDCRRTAPDPFDDPNDDETGVNPFFDKLDSHPLYPEWQNLHEHVDTIDQKQLERLVKVRRYMWT
jgi:hypothetical protein